MSRLVCQESQGRQLQRESGKTRAAEPVRQPGSTGAVASFLQMQRAYGNRHMARVAQAGGGAWLARLGSSSSRKSESAAANDDHEVPTDQIDQLVAKSPDQEGATDAVNDQQPVIARSQSDGPVISRSPAPPAVDEEALELLTATHSHAVGTRDRDPEDLLARNAALHSLQDRGPPLTLQRKPAPSKPEPVTAPPATDPSGARTSDASSSGAVSPLPVGVPRSDAADRAPPAVANLPESPATTGAPQPDGPAPAPKDAEAAPPVPQAIASAPESSFKAEAIAQAQVIHADALRTEESATAMAAARREDVGKQFGDVRTGLAGFFSEAIDGVNNLIAGKQAEIGAASEEAHASAQATIAETLQAIEAQGAEIGEQITTLVDGLVTSVEGQVEGVVNGIIGLINSVSLPDLPGVAQIRGSVVGLLRQAGGVVTSASGQVVGFLRSAVSTGLNLLHSFLAVFGDVINQALSLASSTITRIVQSVLQALNQVATTIIGALRQALDTAILPVLASIESSVIDGIDRAEQQTIAAIHTNRDDHLESLAVAINPTARGDAGDGNTTPSAAGDPIAAIRAIAQEAIANNQQILQEFDQQTSGRLGEIVLAVAGAIARVVEHVSGAVAQAIQAVTSKVAQALQSVFKVAQELGAFLRSLIDSCREAVIRVVEYVRSVVQAPVDRVVQFALSAAARVRDFIGRIVSDVLGGNLPSLDLGNVLGRFDLGDLAPLSGGPITKPSPGPIVIVIRLLFEAIIAVTVAALTVLVGPDLALALVALALANPLVALAIVVVIAIIVLLLLYLLYKWLTKPKPAPPPPPGCTPTPPVPFPAGISTINGPVAPSNPLPPTFYGLTWPEAIQPTTGARCDGTNWLGTLTLLQGDFSEQVRLLPGMQEVTGPAGNTTKGNFCDQVRDLDKLSHSNSGAWYMVAAIQAHEDVHLTRFLPALRHEESAIEALFTALSVPDAPGLTPAAAAAAIRALPAFSTAVSDAQQLWLKEILVRVKGDHARGGPCDVAERGVVDPMIATICAHAKANAWGVCLRCRLRVP